MRMAGLGGRYTIEPLGKHHDRTRFSSGVEVLDIYLRRQASQDIRSRVSTVFVAAEATTGAIHGYYALAMAGVSVELLPTNLVKRMPRYPSIPAVRLGRLAVVKEAQGQGLGEYLLMDSLYRSLQNEIAWNVFLVDALDDGARGFYLHYGFSALSDDPQHLFLIRSTIEGLFSRRREKG